MKVFGTRKWPFLYVDDFSCASYKIVGDTFMRKISLCEP